MFFVFRCLSTDPSLPPPPSRIPIGYDLDGVRTTTFPHPSKLPRKQAHVLKRRIQKFGSRKIRLIPAPKMEVVNQNKVDSSV